MGFDYSTLVPFLVLIVIAVLAGIVVFVVRRAIVYQRSHPVKITEGPGRLPREAFCGMVKHVLLLIFTFGIWNLIWIYRTTGYLNAVEGEPVRNPVTKLLLCMFVPFYSIYWTYKSAQRIDRLAKLQGISSECATLCLILAIFLPIIAPIIMQDKINGIVTSGTD